MTPTSPRLTAAPVSNQRTTDRQPIALPARLTWKDQRGTTRFATVMTKDVSESGVYVESDTALSIPLYRLVQLQLERDGRQHEAVPQALRQGRVLSAVYRVSNTGTSGTPQGLALRLMVAPRRAAAVEVQRARATA